MRFHGSGNGIKYGQFLNINQPLNNGILIEIKSDDDSTAFPVIYATEDFKNRFCTGVQWNLSVQAGGDEFLAVFTPSNPFPIRNQGAFAIDDYIQVTIRDNLGQVSTLELSIDGFTVDIWLSEWSCRGLLSRVSLTLKILRISLSRMRSLTASGLTKAMRDITALLRSRTRQTQIRLIGRPITSRRPISLSGIDHTPLRPGISISNPKRQKTFVLPDRRSQSISRAREMNTWTAENSSRMGTLFSETM